MLLFSIIKERKDDVYDLSFTNIRNDHLFMRIEV